MGDQRACTRSFWIAPCVVSRYVHAGVSEHTDKWLFSIEMECHQLELAFKKSKCTKRQIEMRSFDRRASFSLQKLCFFSKVFLPSFATVKRSNSTKAEGGVLYFSRGATSSSKSCFSKLQVPSNFKFLRLPDVQESGKSCVHLPLFPARVKSSILI